MKKILAILFILFSLSQVLALPKNLTIKNASRIIGVPTETETKKFSISHFFLNTTNGLYTAVGIVIIIIFSLILLSQWKKNISNDNPMLMENQGI